MEEDLEVIYELIKQKEYATKVDISNYLNVSSPSVIKMIWYEDGMNLDNLTMKDIGRIRLTDDGIKMA